MELDYHDLLRVLISVLCGGIIGFEREYKNKSAGFRTLILICLGSTIFTIVSMKVSEQSDDRIAANIITGIGFIGAGVIFKDGLAVKGITTAAVIWVVAALGMVIGIFNFQLSFILTLIVLAVLSVFNWVERLIDAIHHQKTFKITFADDRIVSFEELEKKIRETGLRLRILQLNKNNKRLHVTLEISGGRKKIMQLSGQLIRMNSVEDVLMS